MSCDFGTLKVVPNRFQRARDVLVLEMDKWAVAYLNGRNMISIPLAKTGDSDRRQISREYALEARNEKASGGVFDNTTSVSAARSARARRATRAVPICARSGRRLRRDYGDSALIAADNACRDCSVGQSPRRDVGRSKHWLEEPAGVQVPDPDSLQADACGP